MFESTDNESLMILKYQIISILSVDNKQTSAFAESADDVLLLDNLGREILSCRDIASIAYLSG